MLGARSIDTTLRVELKKVILLWMCFKCYLVAWNPMFLCILCGWSVIVLLLFLLSYLNIHTFVIRVLVAHLKTTFICTLVTCLRYKVRSAILFAAWKQFLFVIHMIFCFWIFFLCHINIIQNHENKLLNFTLNMHFSMMHISFY